RRRHTRSKRDWSSDVCSSDLPQNNRTIYWIGCKNGLTKTKTGIQALFGQMLRQDLTHIRRNYRPFSKWNEPVANPMLSTMMKQVVNMFFSIVPRKRQKAGEVCVMIVKHWNHVKRTNRNIMRLIWLPKWVSNC